MFHILFIIAMKHGDFHPRGADPASQAKEKPIRW
jgi:hypothetical protein